MKSGKLLVPGLSLVLLAACGGGGGGSSSVALLAVTQDLAADPYGTTTVLEFDAPVPLTLGPGSFLGSANQLPLSVAVDGSSVTVVWDERVTPLHEVSVLPGAGLFPTSVAVETSDASAPSFSIASATQNAQGDVLVLDFSGPYVISGDVIDPDSWSLVVEEVELDLSQAEFGFDEATQVLTVTLVEGVGLHEDFEIGAVELRSVADVELDSTRVAGVASGDSSAPTLLSALQNLDADEYGRAVDFTFSEPMSSTFNFELANFQPDLPAFATSVEQVAVDVFRVFFTEPAVPGLDAIDVGSLVDAHGNVFAGASVLVGAGSLASNDFASEPALLAVPNQGGDLLVATFEQAFDPASAEDASHWELECPVGNPIDLSTLELEYDLIEKTLSIELTSDYAFGSSVYFGAVAGDGPVEVDGELFADGRSFTVSGDQSGPLLASAIQNRGVDPSGHVIELNFAEDVEETSAEMTSYYSFSGAQSVSSATLMPNRRTVRLVLDAAAVPTLDTLALAQVEDLAGNAMIAVGTQALVSTDQLAPTPSAPNARAVAGLENDTLYVLFDDAMVESDVEDSTSWSFESPVGTPIDTALASVVYDASTHSALLTFDGGDGVMLRVAEDFELSFSGMRDLGGNEVVDEALVGSVGGELELPEVESVWVEAAFANRVHVRFSEPCDQLDDLYDASSNPSGLTRYVVRDSGGVAKGGPTSVLVDADAMGVELVFGFTVTANDDTLDVTGVIDPAGNALFPALALTVESESGLAPDLELGSSVALASSGEDNDQLTVVFDREMASWGLTDHEHYHLELGGSEVDLSNATFLRLAPDTVGILLDAVGAASLEQGSNYDLEVSGLASAQGVAMTLGVNDVVAVGGDNFGPSLPAGSVRLDPTGSSDAVLIDFSEAVHQDDAADASLVDISGVNPDSVHLVGARSLRAVWSGGVSVGQTVNVSLRDLAGNVGAVSRAITSADGAGPLVASVAGVITEGFGGDLVEIAFDEPVAWGSALNSANYSISSAGQALDLSGATLRYRSSDNAVIFELPEGVELVADGALSVQVSDVYDNSGNPMSSPTQVGGAVSGDSSAPSFLAAFANYRRDANGLAIDVRFSEDVSASFVADSANWSVSGPQSVVSVSVVRGDLVRLTLSAPLAEGDELELDGLPDAAGNSSGSISIAPLL